MSVDLGSALPDLAVTTLDAAGAPADATTITLTIVQPDGTDITPAVTRLSTGRYVADFVPTMPGLHLVRWVATGAVPAAYRDHHHVAASAASAVVSVTELATALRVSAPADVEELRRLAAVATDACEQWTRRVWVRRSFTERHAASTLAARHVLPQHAPVVTVTSVSDDRGPLPSTAWTWTAPTVIRVDVPTEGMLVVALTAGPADGAVPETIRAGVVEMVRHLWQVRRGTGLPTGAEAEWSPDVQGAITQRVRELWSAHSNPGGFA